MRSKLHRLFMRVRSSREIGAKQLRQVITGLIMALPVLLASWISTAKDLLLSFAAMTIVVVKRLRHNLGLSMSALLGIVAVLAMVVCVPIFSHGVSSEVLQAQLIEQALTTRRSLFSLHMSAMDKQGTAPLNVDKVQETTRFIQDNSMRLIGIPARTIIMRVQSATIGLKPLTPRGSLPSDQPWMVMSFVAQDNVPSMGRIVDGRWPLPCKESGEPIEVAVLESTADEMFLNVGDRFRNGPLEIVITGIWTPINSQDPLWYELPKTAFATALWIPAETYQARMAEFFARPVFTASWYVILDDRRLNFANAPEYARGLVRLDSELRRRVPGITIDYSPLKALQAYQERADALTTMFYATGSPMVVLALLFISLTASIAVQQYEQETVTLRGRGTSWIRIASLNLVESVILVAVSVIPSLLLGWMAANLIGHTVSFLKFASRPSIPFSIQGINLTWYLVTIVIIVIARFLPGVSASQISIVRLKQEQGRGSRKPLWERYYLDFLLLLPGIYAYITQSGFAKQLRFIPALDPAANPQYRDLLLFVAPALFVIALCMIVLRFLPLLVRFLSQALENIPQVWAYLAIQQIARRPADYSSALLLIMISLSLAIFSASTAKTLDQWTYDSIYYREGTDFVVHEYAVSSGNTSFSGSSTSTISEADLNLDSYVSMEEHLKLPGVEHVTRVGRYPGTFSYGVGEQECIFMGIDRLDFPLVAFHRNDFAKVSFGELMNALGLEPMGVLVPEDLAEKLGLKIGDTLLTTVNILDQRNERELIVVGIYSYFPTVFPDKRPTLVVNLDSLFELPDEVIGYDIWMKLKGDTDLIKLRQELRSLVGGDGAVIDVRGRALEKIREELNRPERVGLFGVLNVGFLFTGLMPGIGFVLYSYASLRRRFIQLGILQAIGMSLKQLIANLILEQTILMGVAIVVGATVGLASSVLFIPFLQISASGGQTVPPFQVLIGWGEALGLSLAFALILAMTMAGTIWTLMRMKMFQAVKMGEAL
ncbi:ABC transporter permease [Anaerolinea sp.]|uniref:ABC transporter permease n=2 Tax=Anaerolinea TaxID=233189 RepID=UPI00262B2922|nr:ABC transporter permease [uncultured Anaerolinea sp.]